VWVYINSYWYIVGGTSVVAHVCAGIVSSAGGLAPSSQRELTTLYTNGANPSDFRDISDGSCGPNQGYSAVGGRDFCTGLGTPLGKSGK
jgi:hypothetical protein